MTKSIAPFQLRISIHRIIENMILGKLLFLYIQLCHAQGCLSTAFNRLITIYTFNRRTYNHTNQYKTDNHQFH